MKYLVIVLLCAASACALDADQKEHTRKPKLFLISSSTTTTTSTVTTYSVCYSTNIAAALCTGKRKRSLFPDPVSGVHEDVQMVNPSKTISELPLVDSALETGPNRKAKYFLYWLTTTSTSTSTSSSYSTTVSFISLTCTPSNWPYSLCGK